MKQMIKKAIPIVLLQYYEKFRSDFKKSKFIGKAPEEVFKQIFEENHWKSSESISGVGSELTQTYNLINEVNKLIDTLGIKSVLDIPCGDFNWMSRVNLNGIKYTGADIVTGLIDRNLDRFAKSNEIDFVVKNLIKETLPQNDLIINRDCLVHLSYQDIFESLNNIKSSGCKYLLSTTFTNRKLNYNITTGEFRPINLQKAPFFFPTPLLLINEKCTEQNGEYLDKSLGLWLIEDINIATKRKNE